jgi:hypothetical protein
VILVGRFNKELAYATEPFTGLVLPRRGQRPGGRHDVGLDLACLPKEAALTMLIDQGHEILSV